MGYVYFSYKGQYRLHEGKLNQDPLGIQGTDVRDKRRDLFHVYLRVSIVESLPYLPSVTIYKQCGNFQRSMPAPRKSLSDKRRQQMN